MDSEPTNGKLFCVNQQHASIYQLTQLMPIYIVMLPYQSSGLEQQHEKVCSNSMRDGKTYLETYKHNKISSKVPKSAECAYRRASMTIVSTEESTLAEFAECAVQLK